VGLVRLHELDQIGVGGLEDMHDGAALAALGAMLRQVLAQLNVSSIKIVGVGPCRTQERLEDAGAPVATILMTGIEAIASQFGSPSAIPVVSRR
jgi:hypothetical protein